MLGEEGAPAAAEVSGDAGAAAEAADAGAVALCVEVDALPPGALPPIGAEEAEAAGFVVAPVLAPCADARDTQTSDARIARAVFRRLITEPSREVDELAEADAGQAAGGR